MLLNEAKGLTNFLPRKAGVLRKFYSRLKPKLGLAILPLDVHMHVSVLRARRSRTESHLHERLSDSWAK